MASNRSADLCDYVLRQADSSLILGQRLAEWCGHAPELELDIALANLGLDLIGQARLLLTYAGEVEGDGRTEDQLAFLRDETAFRNFLLVEQPNGDFAQTIVRQFLYTSYQELFFAALAGSADARLAAIAEKSLKETIYHVRFSADWVIRLGDGTQESHRRMTDALEYLWRFTDEMFTPDAIDRDMQETGIGPDLAALQAEWDARIDAVLAHATLARPQSRRAAAGGREGHHTEHLGHLLAEMQYLQRAHPGADW